MNLVRLRIYFDRHLFLDKYKYVKQLCTRHPFYKPFPKEYQTRDTS
jgi:hypothetical protein